jgi:NADH-quinone oxidoreductase subunit E
MYKRAPMGKHLVSVCTNFSCAVRGAQQVYQRLVDKLGVGHNETTADGMFTLEHAECLGNCEGAPILSIDYYNYECMTPAGAEQLLDRVAAGDIPEPTRGLRSPGIREISHRLAALGPHPDDVERGERMDVARGTAGGTPPPAAAEVGSEAGLGVIGADASDFSPERDRERKAARDELRSAGQEPEKVEEEAGQDAREFPSRDPDYEPDHAEDGDKDSDG